MRVLLTGATGFIGGHLLTTLLDAGHQVRAVARRPGPPRSGVEWVPGDLAQDHRPTSWLSRLVGVDAVVNAVGIIRETADNRFDAVHQHAPIALFDACKQAGVSVVIQISALGTTDDAPEPYYRSKRAADRHLEGLGLSHLILRPSFVYGRGDHSMQLFKSLATLPVVPMVGDGSSRSSPVHVSTLCQAVARAVEDPAVRGRSLDVGGSTHSFREILGILRAWAGLPPRAPLAVPVPLVAFTARVLGNFGPITLDELSMLSRGAATDSRAFIETFGGSPLGFTDGLAREPATPSDLQSLALFPVIPLVRVAVGFIWVATAITTLWVHPRAETLDLLGPTGLPPALLDALCYAELGIGLLTWAGVGLRWLGTLQIGLMLSFMVELAVVDPMWWTHPYGPLTKNIPLIAATLVMIVTARR